MTGGTTTVVSPAHRFLHGRMLERADRRTWVLYGQIYDWFYHDLLHGCVTLRRSVELWALHQGVELTVTLRRDGTVDFSGNRDPQAAEQRFNNTGSGRPPRYGNRYAPSSQPAPPPTDAQAPANTRDEQTQAQAQQTAQAAQQAAGGSGQLVLNTVNRLSQWIAAPDLPNLVVVEDLPSLVYSLRRSPQTQAVADELVHAICEWVQKVALTNLLVFITPDREAMEEILPKNLEPWVQWQEIKGPEPSEIQAAVERAARRQGCAIRDAAEIAKRLASYNSLRVALNPVTRALVSGQETLTMKSVFNLPPLNQAEIEQLRQELNELVGLKEVKAKFESIVRRALDMRRRLEAGEPLPEETMHMVFSGNPGTGKTTVARIMARLFHAAGLLPRAEVLDVIAADVMSSHVGETRERMQAKLEQARGGVLFIDEAHQFGDPQSLQAKEAVKALVPASWNLRQDVVIILAGYAHRMPEVFRMDPGLARRFPEHGRLEFADYSLDELWQILERKLKRAGFTVEEKAQPRLRALLRRRSQRSGFGNAGGVENLVSELLERHRNNPSPRLGVITADDLPPVAQRHPEVLSEAWRELDRLVGVASVRERLERLMLKLQYDLESDEAGHGEEVRLHPGNMVFVGPSGTGKTTVGRLIAKLLYGVGYLERPVCTPATRADLVGEYLGQTAPKTRALVEQARGGVLFIDEAYSLAGDEYGREAVAELIAQITSPENAGTVFVLSGYQDEIEGFLRTNPGLGSRFPVVIEFPPFTPDDCAELARRLFERGRYTWEAGVLEQVRALAEEAQRAEGRHFGNARWVEALVEGALERMKARVIQSALPTDHPERRMVKLQDLPQLSTDPDNT